MNLNLTYSTNITQLNQHDFNVMQINIHSLRKKMEDLEALICQLTNVHVLIVSETWIHDWMERFYNIDGYVSYHATRPDGYGGLSVFVRQDVKHRLVGKGSHLADAVQMVEIDLCSVGLHLFGLYRRPDEGMARTFIDFIDEKVEGATGCLIAGDINFNLLRGGGNVELYKSMIADNGFHFLNDIQPGAYTYPILNGPGTPGSIVDHFATDEVSKSYNVSLLDTSLTEHRALVLSMRNDAAPPPLTQNRSFCLSEALRQLSDQLQNLRSPSLLQIHEALVDVTQCNTREILSPARSGRLPWIDSAVLGEMAYRDRLNIMRKQFGLAVSVRETRERLYRDQKNKVTSMIRKAKKRFVDGMFHGALGNQKKIWDALKFVLNNQTSQPQTTLPQKIVAQSGNLISDPEEVAEELVSHFTEIPLRLRDQLVSRHSNRPRRFTLSVEVPQSIYPRAFNEGEVEKVFRNLRSKAAAGVDGISAQLIKKAPRLLVKQLTEAANISVRRGEFPGVVKAGRVTPLFKSGDPTDANHYRPVTVLSNFGKVFEKLVVSVLQDFVHSAGIIHHRQFGFTSNSNTTAATLNAVLQIVDSIERSCYTSAIFIDVSKAFDCVDHGILLQKLERLGIRGPMHTLIQDYLFGRRHRVQAGSVASSFQYVRCGVPQGSPLSSLMFLLYMNDIFHLPLRGRLQLFADDAMIIYSCVNLSTLETWMNEDLALLDEWFYNNLLTLNVSKTKFMIFTQRSLVVDQFGPVIVDGEQVERVYSYKYLGLVIDSSLTWIDHLELIKKKVRPFLALLRRSHYLLEMPMRRSVYYAHIHPHFLHLASVWGAAVGSRVEQLTVMQNKAVRHLFWHDYHVLGLTTEELYRKHGILRVTELVKYENVMTVFRIRNGLLRSDVAIPSNDELGVRSTRRQTLLNVPRSRTDYHKNSILHRGVNWYNELPREIRHAPDILTFKRSLKNMLNSSNNAVDRI